MSSYLSDTLLASTDVLFGALADVQTPRTAIGQSAVASAARLISTKDYEGAIRELKRSVAMDPTGDNGTQAYTLMAKVYMQLGDKDAAIKAYQSAARLDPTSADPHVQLGNIYYGEKDYANAEAQYQLGVRLDPSSSTALFSLGQVYLATNRYDQAESTFKRVIGMAPAEHGGYYALGQTYAKEGHLQEAVDQFQTTLRLKSDFYQARVDLGIAYADQGDLIAANEQVRTLKAVNTAAAGLVTAHIDQITKPKILGAYSVDGYLDAIGPGSPVATLGPQLAAPGSSAVFSMSFLFSKAMDEVSTENALNWSITRTTVGSPSGAYNNGLAPPATDAAVMPIPIRVDWDKESNTARVFFAVAQNATGDATIDTSHLLFKFKGKDTYGTAIDPRADEFNAISLIL